MSSLAATETARLVARSNEIRAAYKLATTHEERVSLCAELDAVHAEQARLNRLAARGMRASAFGAALSTAGRR